MDYNNPDYAYPTEFRPARTGIDGEEITPENAIWDPDTQEGALQPDQYLPWNGQQLRHHSGFGLPFDSSSSSSSSQTTLPNPQQSHPLRYQPYQIPPNSHTLPHVPHSHSLNQPHPFPHFDLADPSFLLPDSEGTLKEWQEDKDTDRRDSNSSTQHSGHSGGSRENSDPTSIRSLATAATTANTHGAKRQINEGLPALVGNGAEAVESEQSGAPKKVVKKADKSCRKCRDRRVRCDRIFPICDRCRKRRETCAYVDNVNVDEFEEGGDAQKVLELQSKVAALEKQLKTMGSNPSPADESSSSAISPPERRSQYGRSGAIDGSPNSGTSSNVSGRNPSRTPPGNLDGNSSSIASGIGDIYTNQLRFKQDEMDNLTSYLMGRTVSFANLGHSNPNWRLGEPAVIKQLTIHLMEAATHACCANIPGIKPLADRVEYYKRNLDRLDGPGNCAVAVLSALGARASPHSALLGVATTCLADGTPSPPLFLYAGERREIACRALERRAREICWMNGMLESSSLPDLDAIIGLTQVLIFESDEEILPEKSRFFTRIAVGMYHDLRFKALERQERTSRDPRIGPGTALFLADAVIAAASSRPSFISTAELETYFLTDGVPIPDFPGSNLRDELDKILQKPLQKEKLVDAVTSGIIWVSGCSRLFAQLTMTRRANAPSPLPLLKNLWSLIDSVHNSLQHLQSILVHLDLTQVGDLDDSPYALDHFVLLGVRADSILVDLINLMHVWLQKDRNQVGIWTEKEEDPLLISMRKESELRVRKCLKLSAFYAQLFLSSQDKHLVHHMMMQLEILPDWTDWVVQRAGSPGGPPTEEYEITESELDWFQRALELSCYYTPRAGNRLQRLTAVRQAEAQRPSARFQAEPVAPPVSLESIQPQQAIYDNTLYHNGNSYESSNGDQGSKGGEQSETFPLGGGWVSAPSSIFVFDDYGIAAQQGYPIGTQESVSADETFRSAFTGESWLAVPHNPGTNNSLVADMNLETGGTSAEI